MSREKLGAALGVSGQAVWRWETGRCIPHATMIQSIREYSGGAVTADDHHAVYYARRDAEGAAA